MLEKDCLRQESEPDSDFIVVRLRIKHTRVISLSSSHEIRSIKTSAPILTYNLSR